MDNVKLVESGRMLEKEMRDLLAAARYPARNPDQNIADLRAQVAANEKGVQELRRMVAHFGLDVVRAYMGHVQDNAEECVRRVIGVLKDGEFAYEMDNGAVIRVRITIGADRRSATIDFTGTSAQLPNNFNAPTAVCMAAVLYVFRTLVDADIPLNSGCLKPLEVVVPDGSMLRPRYPAAVVYAAVLYVFRTLVDDDIPLNAGCLKPLQVIIPEGSMLNPRPPAATVAAGGWGLSMEPGGMRTSSGLRHPALRGMSSSTSVRKT